MKVYAGEPLGTEIPDTDLVSFTLARAGERGDEPALIDGSSGEAIGYARLEREVRSFAAGLAARGFAKGDTLAIHMPNAPEYAVASYGTLAAGGRCTTVNPLYTARELGFQLEISGARALLSAPAFIDVARKATVGRECELLVLGEAEGAAPYSELLGDPDAALAPAIDPTRDVAALPFSSGTTGLPKGVMLSHRNLVANTLQMAAHLRVEEGETVIAVLPLFHIYGLSVIMNVALWAGATLVTMPRFELGPYLELSERHRVTRAYVAPPIALALADDPAATAAMIDPEGWLRTGDIATADEDGWFYIVDRVKELIKYKGFQVAPAELEAILITHPGVLDCAVIGVPDGAAGELPKAFVVPAAEGLDHGEVMEFVASRVAHYKRIRAIELIEEIPKSPSGKVLRRELRERAGR